MVEGRSQNLEGEAGRDLRDPLILYSAISPLTNRARVESMHVGVVQIET
jgi:hypothetical protein